MHGNISLVLCQCFYTKWMDWIYLAKFWYNTSWHSATGHSPFEVLYGHKPSHFGLDSSATCDVDDLSGWLQQREVMINLIQQHLLRTQKWMKLQADKYRTGCQFHVGDWVYLKVQPYVQSSLAPHSNQKLAFKFFGPFQIVSRHGCLKRFFRGVSLPTI